jgi:replicative DNA helicase
VLDEHGDVKTEADIVLLLNRNVNPQWSADRKVEIIVAKNNSGPTAICEAVFLSEFCRFTDYTDYKDSPEI